MDFDDLDDPFQAPQPKPSRFAPKAARFQPKSTKGPGLKVEPKVETPVVVKKEEDSHSVSSSSAAAEKMDVDGKEFLVKNGGDDSAELKEEEEETTNAMEEDDVEVDHVVAEYDVYYNPRDPATQVSEENCDQIGLNYFVVFCVDFNEIVVIIFCQC